MPSFRWSLVVALAVVLVLLGKAQSTLFDRARAACHRLRWRRCWRRCARRSAGFDRWMGSIGEIFSVYQENLQLKDENARLRQWRNVAIVLQGPGEALSGAAACRARSAA